MIYEKSRSHLYKKIRKLKGFVNEKTIKKYIEKNRKVATTKSKFNLNKLFIILGLFCSIIFLYHLYTLWREHHTKDKSTKQDIALVPLSGRY